MALDNVKFEPLSDDDRQATGMRMRVTIEGDEFVILASHYGIKVGDQSATYVCVLPDKLGLTGLLKNSPAVDDSVRVSIGDGEAVDTGFKFDPNIV